MNLKQAILYARKRHYGTILTSICEYCCRFYFIQNSTRSGSSCHFCSRRCAGKARSRDSRLILPCAWCGKNIIKPKSVLQGHANYYCSVRHKYLGCGKLLSGSRHPRWKGGRRKLKSGYILVFSDSHKDNSVLEHRLVMERKIGRALKSFETVHHRNGIRDDNRLNNLELWIRKGRQPNGQRVGDLVRFYVKNYPVELASLISK